MKNAAPGIACQLRPGAALPERSTTIMQPTTTDKKLLRVEEAAKLLGIGRTRAFELIKEGRLRSVKLGKTRLVPAKALDELVELLLSESTDAA